MNIENTLNAIIEKYELTVDNYSNRIKEIGYVDFFNTFTTSCLGTPTYEYTLENKKGDLSAALIFLPDESSKKLIKEFDRIYISSLYLGVICNRHLCFNYENYIDFIKELVLLRKYYKQKILEDKTDTLNNLKQYIIKTYLNAIYGMIDNSDSCLRVTNEESPRKYITETGKDCILHVSSFLLNNSKPIHYIDTDEIFTGKLNTDLLNGLNEFYANSTDIKLDKTISKLELETERNCFCLIYSKKSFLISSYENSRIFGNFPYVDEIKTLNECKKYFGKKYQNIFPEYSI